MSKDEAKFTPDHGIEVEKIISRFPNKVIFKNNKNNLVMSPTLNRAGLELASTHAKHQFSKIDSTILWGTNETNYLNCLNNNKAVREALSNVLTLDPPLIILCAGFTHANTVKQVAKNVNCNTTIVTTPWHSHQLYLSISGWLNQEMATYTLIHGTFMFINGIGVLIQGDSGIGKSEVALQLISLGALFVADDAIEATNLGYKIFARPSSVAEKFMEVRGIGLINAERMFGANHVKCATNIDIIISLEKSNDLNRQYFERVGKIQQYKNLLGVQMPIYHIPVTTGRDIANMIIAAVGDFKLKDHGYNSAEEYMKNYLTQIKKPKK